MPDTTVSNKILQLSEQLKDDAFAFLERLVNSNSFTANRKGLDATAELIIAEGRRLGLRFEKRTSNVGTLEAEHLLCRLPDQGRPFYGLIGHFDTVHAPESPFNTYRDEGAKIYGPGVQDMKSGLVSALYSTVLLRELHGTVPPFCLLFNSDEETGSQGSRPLIEEEMRLAEAAFIFEGHNADHPQLVTSRKGITMGKITTHGRTAHAGEAPQTGINAVVEMAWKVLQLQKLNDFEAGKLVTTGTMQGGVTANQIPEKCESALDVRYNRVEDGAELLKKINAILQQDYLPGATTEFQLKQVRPPFERTAATKRLFDIYAQAAGKFGRSFTEKAAGGGSDANLTAAIGIPSIDGLGCAGDGPHTDHEYILKNSLIESIQNFSLFFHRLVNP